MANVKISQLPTATTLTTADLLPIVQGGVTKQVTPDLLPVSAATTAALAANATADRNRANHTGTQATSTITGLDTTLAAKADLVGGLVPSSQIPAIALTNAVTVASQAAMLALTTTQVQPGDVAVRTDGAGTFILTTTDPTQLGNWVRLNAPTDAVTTVNGQSGTVVLAKADVGLGNVDNTSDVNKPVSTAQATAAANTTINLPVNVMSANGTAVIGARNAVNASAGPVAVTLPNPTAVGQHIIIERSDTSAVAANTITITGTIRGVGGTVVTLAAVGAANEGGHYIAESLTSWAIAGSIKPKAVLDKYYDAFGAASSAVAALGTASTKQVAYFDPAGAGSAYFRAAAIGDSTTAGGLRATDDVTVQVGNTWGTMGGGGEQKGGPTSWFTWMCLYSNGRITAHYNGGVSSDTTTGMLARFSTILNSGANLLFIGDAHNDFTGAIAEATTRANIISMISQAQAAGMTVVLRTIYPDVVSTTIANQIRRHNAWLLKYAAANHLHIIDTYGAVVDPASTTGAWLAGYSSDGTHPSVAAAIIAGKRALDGMTGLLRGSSTVNPALPVDNVIASQLLQNALFTVDANFDQRPEGWSASSSAVVRTVTDAATTLSSPTVTSATANFTSDDIGRVLVGAGIPANAAIRTVNSTTSVAMHVNATATATGVTVTLNGLGCAAITDSAVVGKAWRVVVSAGLANVNQTLTVDGTTIAVGDRLRWVGMMKFEGAAAGNMIPQPVLTFLGTYMANPVTYATGVDTGWFTYSVEATVPSGATNVRVGFTTSAGTGNIYLAQQGLYNLTKLG